MNRFIVKIVFAGLFAAQFAPTAVFAQIPPQLIFVQVLKALLKEASATPLFATARRVKVSGERDIADIEEEMKVGGATQDDIAALRMFAGRAVAADMAYAIASANVIAAMNAEMEGIIGAAKAIATPQFVADQLMENFAPKISPKKVSVLEWITAHTRAAGPPTDVEIRAAEEKVEDAKANLAEAKKTDNDSVIAEERAELDKAKAELAALREKGKIYDAVASCSYTTNPKAPNPHYFAVKRLIAERIQNNSLLRIGALIGNPYVPEDGKFKGGFRIFGIISSARVWELRLDEQRMAEDARELARKTQGERLFVGYKEFAEVRLLFRLHHYLTLFVLDCNRTVASTFSDTLEWTFTEEATAELTKAGILGTNGLVERFDYFLKIQKDLLTNDIVELKNLIDGAQAEIGRALARLAAAIQVAEQKLADVSGETHQLGSLSVDDPNLKKQMADALQSYLSCNPIDDFLRFLKTKVRESIEEAIVAAVAKDLIAGELREFRRLSREEGSLEDLQKGKDAYIKLQLGFGIRFLRNVQTYPESRTATLASIWGKSVDDMLVANPKFRDILVQMFSGNSRLVAVRELLSYVDAFIAKFEDILTNLKPKYRRMESLITEKEKLKKEAMDAVETGAGVSFAPGPVPAFPKGDICTLFGAGGFTPQDRRAMSAVYTCTTGNRGASVFAGICCESNRECTHPEPHLDWGTGGQPSPDLDNYTSNIAIANNMDSSRMTEAKLVAQCNMDLATDPKRPFEGRSGCRNFPTPEVFEARVCGAVMEPVRRE